MKRTEQSGADEDIGIVVSVKEGSVDEFERLVEKYQKRVLNIAYRMTGNYEDACEVAQDAFLSAYKNLPAFKGMSRFSTWLYAIVINLSKNRIQQMKTVQQHEKYSLDDPVETDDGSMARDFTSGESSVVEKLEREEIRKRVQDCIGRLDAESREVIVLRDIQGFSYGEMAGMLKIAEGTVKSRLFRARDALKDCLQKVLGEL